jgi:hypothetical protein
LNDFEHRARVAKVRDAIRRLAATNQKTDQPTEKENPMKTQILAIASALLFSTVMASESRAQSRTMEANVPFAFEVGEKTMPAGTYRIESVLTGSGTLQVIRNANGDVQVTVSTILVPAKSENSAVELIFHRYGSHNFLAQIQNGDGHARELFESQLEKKLARSQAMNEIALLTHVPAERR